MKNRNSFILIAVIFVFCITTFMAGMIEARGRGGGGRRGGGFSRGGPAAGGGFSSRSAARQPARQVQRQPASQEQPRTPDRDLSDRQDQRDDAREDRQEHRDDAREDRQDYYDDHNDDDWDDHHHYHGGGVVAGMAVGSAINSSYVSYVPCNNTVMVNNITYYHCDANWYKRGYEGGDVVYIITTAPAGY
jgi:hypothetical protein